MASTRPPGDPTLQAYGHSERIFDLAFHPTRANILASASEDLTARIWRLEDGSDVYKQVGALAGGWEAAAAAC